MENGRPVIVPTVITGSGSENRPVNDYDNNNLPPKRRSSDNHESCSPIPENSAVVARGCESTLSSVNETEDPDGYIAGFSSVNHLAERRLSTGLVGHGDLKMPGDDDISASRRNSRLA